MGELKHPADAIVDRYASDKTMTLGDLRAAIRDAVDSVVTERDHLLTIKAWAEGHKDQKRRPFSDRLAQATIAGQVAELDRLRGRLVDALALLKDAVSDLEAEGYWPQAKAITDFLGGAP